ncbi:MAG: hypothetical protein J0G32_02540 [Alphaproteobacteria bacterium]|nr:hypothetical protein [Alphaproteobacteria bacterium]OJV12170.1 MAG: hypothetical protein BGO27_05470 [Alphaproteobacteria bacterium 33-17]
MSKITYLLKEKNYDEAISEVKNKQFIFGISKKESYSTLYQFCESGNIRYIKSCLKMIRHFEGQLKFSVKKAIKKNDFKMIRIFVDSNHIAAVDWLWEKAVKENLDVRKIIDEELAWKVFVRKVVNNNSLEKVSKIIKNAKSLNIDLIENMKKREYDIFKDTDIISFPLFNLLLKEAGLLNPKNKPLLEEVYYKIVTMAVDSDNSSYFSNIINFGKLLEIDIVRIFESNNYTLILKAFENLKNNTKSSVELIVKLKEAGFRLGKLFNEEAFQGFYMSLTNSDNLAAVKKIVEILESEGIFNLDFFESYFSMCCKGDSTKSLSEINDTNIGKYFYDQNKFAKFLCGNLKEAIAENRFEVALFHFKKLYTLGSNEINLEQKEYSLLLDYVITDYAAHKNSIFERCRNFKASLSEEYLIASPNSQIALDKLENRLVSQRKKSFTLAYLIYQKCPEILYTAKRSNSEHRDSDIVFFLNWINNIYNNTGSFALITTNFHQIFDSITYHELDDLYIVTGLRNVKELPKIENLREKFNAEIKSNTFRNLIEDSDREESLIANFIPKMQ